MEQIKEKISTSARLLPFQMASFRQVNRWLSRGEALHHLSLGWSAVIADFLMSISECNIWNNRPDT